MYTTSRVIKIIDSETVLVGCSVEACNSCKAELFCNSKNNTSFTAKKPKELQLSSGDWVELYMHSGKTVGSIALVFAVPLLLFPAGYLLMKNLSKANELINALGGLVAMAIGFGLASLINIKYKRNLMPEITKVISLEDTND